MKNRTFYSTLQRAKNTVFHTVVSRCYFCLCWGSEFGLRIVCFFSFILCNPLEMTWSSATEMELQKRPLTSSGLWMRAPLNLIVWLRSMSARIFTYHSKSSDLFVLSFWTPFFLPQSRDCYHIYFSDGACWTRAFFLFKTQFMPSSLCCFCF